jgi:hypothetical protein
MDTEKILPAAPAEMIQRALGSALNPGELGVVLARAGVGKTACLTHISLDYLLRSKQVLHVCIDELPEKIKIWYRELIKNLGTVTGSPEPLLQVQQIESSRFIMAFLHHTFSPNKLDQSVRNLSEQVGFKPALIVVDGLDFERAKRPQIEAMQQLAERHQAALWLSCRTHRHIDIVNDHGIPYPCHELDDLFQAILMLEPEPQNIRITVLKHYEQYTPAYESISLSPRTYLLNSNGGE